MSLKEKIKAVDSIELCPRAKEDLKLVLMGEKENIILPVACCDYAHNYDRILNWFRLPIEFENKIISNINELISDISGLKLFIPNDIFYHSETNCQKKPIISRPLIQVAPAFVGYDIDALLHNENGLPGYESCRDFCNPINFPSPKKSIYQKYSFRRIQPSPGKKEPSR